ncbi:3-deoxy-D-manno-octulosonic acid transferase [Bacteroidota bacterium]
MRFLYTLSIYFYTLFIRIASLVNEKARKWIIGRRGILTNIKQDLAENTDKIIWFHCASLGEFEMGKPVIELLRQKHPQLKILITFFSPSGYEIRKNHEGGDYIYYLPVDTPQNARKFIKLVKPIAAVFIKYEFWFNYINELKNSDIPLFSISAVFRKDQHFFKWYGGWFRKHLKFFSWIYVQTNISNQLLQNIGIQNVTTSGDTRFDRVIGTVSNTKELPLIETFSRNSRIFVAGSSWHPDEEVYLKTCIENCKDIKLIIAPHDVSENRIASIEKKIDKPTIRYSKIAEGDQIQQDILIIDSIGILANIYRYADLAFIGGAFGSGLHNILEAVAFGCPVFFGPKNDKFWEASTLAEKGGAFIVKSEQEFKEHYIKLINNEKYYQQCSEVCKNFVEENSGGSNIIANGILKVLTF